MRGHEQPRDKTMPYATADAVLELLAIEEQYVAQIHAGEQPRLSAYVARYPAHAAALVAWYASVHDPLPHNGAAPEIAANAAMFTDSAHTSQTPFGSAGMQHALHRLFGADAKPDTMLDLQSRVAERGAPYTVDGDERAASVDRAREPHDETPG